MPLPAPFEDSLANQTAIARARGAIAEHRAAFEAFEAGALRAEDPLEAAALARMAYTYAMFNLTGRYASAPLEQLLHRLGREHVPGDPGAAPAPEEGAPERVLHVATVVYETGGHTRVLERWLERDTDRASTVLLLKDDEPLPESVRRTIAATGAAFADPLPASDLFATARTLRALAAEHDLVVFHVSNHEVVVPLAFADPVGRPPTIYFNHSSHLMWTGVGCSDVVASFNAYDSEVSVERRGVPPERAALLPLPVSPRALPLRAEARRQLGLDPDAPVLLTVASPYKLQPVLAPTYRDLATAVLDAVPDATLLIVGPRPADDALPQHDRARAFGAVSDLGAFLAAADVLLDSWPITGGTTATDAAAAGLPVLALGEPPVRLVGPRLDQLGRGLLCAPDVSALATRAAALLRDAGARFEIGHYGRETVLERSDRAWGAAMEALIAGARANAGDATPPGEIAAHPLTDEECIMHLVRPRHEQTCTLHDAYVWNAAELPLRRRAETMRDVVARCAALLSAAPSARRAVAAPAIDAASIAGVIAEARRLVADGKIESCALVVCRNALEDAVGMIGVALADGEDLDVELIVGDSVEAAAAPDDLVLLGETRT